LLRQWLPGGYHVRTKGRILGDQNVASKQIDVVVLKPGYPNHLLDKKMYLAAGVAAAFECKLSLRSAHIKKAFEVMRGVLKPRQGSVYEELHVPFVYGILSHSSSWESPGSRAVDNVTKILMECQSNMIAHPREEIDRICVADLATWTIFKSSMYGPEFLLFGFGIEGYTNTTYMCSSVVDPTQKHAFTPIGYMISFLWRRFGFEDPRIRSIAEYFWYTTGPSASFGSGRSQRWMNASIFSEKTLTQMRAGRRSEGWWDYWRPTFL
jgi:hypothetical protein